MTDFETLRSNKAIVAHRQINCDTGGATVQCVVLADGFIVECGSDGYAQERAAHLADAINAFGADTHPAPSDGAVREIASERLRQIAKGYDSSHDDAHSDGSIAMAAAAYAKEAARKSGFKRFHPSPLYPWSYSNFDEKPPRDAMIVAAALCVAEIERLDRIVLAQPPAEKEG